MERRLVLLSPLPVRERMKVRVRIQRASFARESGFCSFSLCFSAPQALIDRAKNLLHTLKHLAIPESKHSIALRLEKRGADFIFSRSIKMLRPIELNDEPSLSRAEIGEVCTDRKLASKLGAAQLPIPQMPPQNPLRLSLLAPQPPRIVLGRFNRSHRIECLRSVEEKQVPRKEQNPDPRAKDARCIRTLTLILSLTGRGDRKAEEGMSITQLDRIVITQ
jgi:hypothetical protein